MFESRFKFVDIASVAGAYRNIRQEIRPIANGRIRRWLPRGTNLDEISEADIQDIAMTLNLNTEAYDGGHLRFPEYGSTLYRPDTGEAVIFSCSLLHEAMPVTQGRRFALLTFFYGDAEAKIRAQDQQQVLFSGVSMGQISKQARSLPGNTAFGFQGDRAKKKKR